MVTIKVLAIDDSRTIREMLRFTLKQGGYEVYVAVDGVDGMEKLPTVNPDAVITDINMPRMDGFGVIEAIRTSVEYSKLPVLVLTTESAENLKSRARSIGATGWIVKPFDDKKLLNIMRRVTMA